MRRRNDGPLSTQATSRCPSRLLATLAVLTLAACAGGGRSAVQETVRGPGLSPAPVTVDPGVPRTAALTHVDPQVVAAALGHDVDRLFAFLRDAVAYEPYPGVLRGARGTLLAMAGNSPDRALLLAAILQAGGRRVRFARGTLDAARARALVTSAWAPRPDPASATTPAATPAGPAADGTFAFLDAAARRDFALLREHLKGVATPRTVLPTVESLIAEARPHYWVQVEQDGRWIDLDPSFADAVPGRAWTRVEETRTALPDTLFHTLTVVVRVEERGEGPAVTRDLLRFTARAADLSAADLVLLHMPEAWTPEGGGAAPLPLGPEGGVKPVLIVGGEILVGESFRWQPEGGGRVRSLLSGEGLRRTATVVTAEWLVFEVAGPDGQRETVVRELWDALGPARRAAGGTLSPEDLQALAAGRRSADLTGNVYSTFVTTGRLAPVHLREVAEDPPTAPEDAVDLRAVLHRISLWQVAAADALIDRLHGRGAGLAFYPASPRLVIAEVSDRDGVARAAIDLRRHARRLVGTEGAAGQALAAQVFRGVVEGTLERVVMETLTGGAGPLVSTSTLLDQARREQVPIVRVDPEARALSGEVPADARERVRDDLRRGFLVVAPLRPLTVAGRPRLAWWRVEPASGLTTGVTDEGLHQTGTEQQGTRGAARYQTRVIVTRDLRGPNPHVSVEIRQLSLETGEVATHSFTAGLRLGTRSVASFVQRMLADPRQQVRVWGKTILGP